MSKDKESKEQPFESLVLKLEGWFDKLLADLTDEIQELVTDGPPFFGLWDELKLDDRRKVAEEWDYQHDPETRVNQEKDFLRGFVEEGKKIDVLNVIELQALKRKNERQKRSMARKMKRIAQRPRNSRKKVSDESINEILDRKPEHIKERNKVSWLQGQLTLKGVNISTTQLRTRLRFLAG